MVVWVRGWVRIGGMLKAGVICILLGVCLALLSAGLAAWAGAGVTGARQVASLPLEVGESGSSSMLDVSADGLVQTTMHVTVKGDEMGDGIGGDRELAYVYPVQIEVVDGSGEVIHSGSTAAAFDEGVIWQGGSLQQDGQTVARAEHSFSKFEPPNDGHLKVRATLEQDTTHDNALQAAELRVYEGAEDSGALSAKAIGAVAACCAGPLVTGLGIVLALVGLVQRQG